MNPSFFRGLSLKAMAGAFAALSAFGTFASPALAQGHGRPGQLGMLEPVTAIASDMHDFHNLLLVVIKWYWSYDYPKDQGDFGFDQILKADKDLKAGEPRLLTVDNEAVVLVNKTVRLQVTAGDVIHSFTIPAFGVRIDAVPGRLNETWFKAEREGLYYGQCSKICGKDHAYMPIAVRVVSEQQYQAWLADAKKKFAALPPSNEFADNAAARQ